MTVREEDKKCIHCTRLSICRTEATGPFCNLHYFLSFNSGPQHTTSSRLLTSFNIPHPSHFLSFVRSLVRMICSISPPMEALLTSKAKEASLDIYPPAPFSSLGCGHTRKGVQDPERLPAYCACTGSHLIFLAINNVIPFAEVAFLILCKRVSLSRLLKKSHFHSQPLNPQQVLVLYAL